MPEKSISQFLISVGALTLEEIDREIAATYTDPSISRLLEAARIVILERDGRVSSSRTVPPFASPHSDRPHSDAKHIDSPHGDRHLQI